MTGLIDCVTSTWSPGIGDPGPSGWITVAAYVAASALTYRAARREKAATPQIFWLVLCGGLALLAVNKQLDLQSALTATGRCWAKKDGWYEDRRAVQSALVAMIAVWALLSTAALGWSVRHHLDRLWPAVLGAGVVLGFVTVRAAGFHHVDRWIGQGAEGLTVNAGLEIGGLALIAWGAARAAGRRL